MKEKPIIFSTEMVKVILADRKTKTRRLNGLKEINENPDQWHFREFSLNTKKHCLEAVFEDKELHLKFIRAPWEGHDVLWVRETWNCLYIPINNKTEYWYKAGDEFEDSADEKWRPSIFMPRTAARLFLEVKDIQIERIQGITEEDIKAEGIEFCKEYDQRDIPLNTWDYYKNLFRNLWDSINLKRGYPFESNSWVWVVEFERVEG
jgi:hypothetical protein